MGEWSKCLEDIEAAIEFFSYPLELSYKLLDRKAKCLIQLGRRWEAKEAFQQSLNHLGSATNLKPEKRESFGAEIKTAIDRLSSEKLEKPEKGYFVSNKDFNSKGNYFPIYDECQDSFSKGFGPAMRTGSIKTFPTIPNDL